MNNMITDEIINLRREVIFRDFARMNDMQRQAVFHTVGPLLILAGAGSGKTTVLINRIANMIKYGNGFESEEIPFNADASDVELLKAYLNGGEVDSERLSALTAVNAVRPWEIFAITFTNKAAGELKERLATMLGNSANDITAATFHSACARILRRFADRIGYTNRFTIYDTDDSRRLMKECQKLLSIDDKLLPFKSILTAISHAKDNLISTKEFYEQAGSDFRQKKIAQAYELYQKRLKQADAMDFDDIIVNTVNLFEDNGDVLEYCQNRYKYIMVDEYQDTNHAQYIFIKMLAKKHRNICVVGDDNQSIYRFRGATIENILSFEKQYSDAKTIRLEQNYRSTGTILDAANAVIKNNKEQREKNLWTDIGEGDKIKIFTAEDEYGEARFVAENILDFVKHGERFDENAILYRMNAQSGTIESVFARSGIPYKVIGGMKFYDRKEVKDVLAYMQVISNPADALHLRRIINEPKRGIGTATVEKAVEIATNLGIPLFDVISLANNYEPLSRTAAKLLEFSRIMKELIVAEEELPLHDLITLIIDKTEYIEYLKLDSMSGQERIENVNELITTVMHYEQETEGEEATLEGFLESISLISDIDNYNENAQAVVLMTMHSAKGLEFKNVFIVGMEEGVFPGSQSIFGGEAEMEEERRLAYVGITRAKRRLFLLNAYSRMIFGTTMRNRPSRFLLEVPEELTDVNGYIRTQQNSIAIKQKTTEGNKTSFNSLLSAQKKPQSEFNFKVGDRVSHKAFGEGMVVDVKKMSSDTLLTIAFDSVGTKKLMANFAKLAPVE